MPKQVVLKLVVALLLLSVYYAAGRLGLSMAFVNASATAVWAPTGIALAALLVLGYWVWPVILLAAFLVNISSGSVGAALIIAIGNTLEGLIGAYLVNRFANGRLVFDRAGDIFKFAFLAAMLAPVVSATIGVMGLLLNRLADWPSVGPIWLTWWLGDATGALIVTPLLVLWASSPWLPRWTPSQAAEAMLLMLSMILLALVVFGDALPFSSNRYPLAFLMLPPVIWTAFRFSPREVTVLITVLLGIALQGTLDGFGPFVRTSPNESLLFLQIFVATVTLTGLILAAVVNELDRVMRSSHASNERYRIVSENARDAIIVIDARSVISYVNGAGERLFGYRADELVGQELTMLMPEVLRDAHRKALGRYVATGQKRNNWDGIELPGQHHDGHELQLEISFGEYVNNGGTVFVGIVRDISARKRAEEAQLWLATIVESSDDAIIGKTLDGIVISWNRAAETIYGYTAAEMVGRSISVIVPPDHADELSKLLEAIRNGERMRNFETERIRKDGKRISVSLTISPIKDGRGNIIGTSVIARDVTERRQAEEHIRYQANHDQLTGLPNRMVCYDRIGQAIGHARRNRTKLAVLFLDLDGFKPINDKLGHQIGDEILRMVATRLQHCLREDDTVARLGGDEFVICLPAITDSNVVAAIADKVLESLHAPFAAAGKELYVGVSIGISLFPNDGTDTQALLRAADAAMYRVKEMGRGRYEYAASASKTT